MHPLVSGSLTLVAVAGIFWLAFFVYGKLTGDKGDSKKKKWHLTEDGGAGE